MPITVRNRIQVSRMKTIIRINPAKIVHYVSITKVQVTFTLMLVTKATGEQKYDPTLSLTSALDVGNVQHQVSATLPPGKRPDSNCTEGSVGPTAGLD